MTQRTYTQKDGTIWEWEETPETVEALKKYHSKNYSGPLYEPHPDLTNKKNT